MTSTAPLPTDSPADRLDGKVALVTGANGASGAPVAAALAARGADVALVHRGSDQATVQALGRSLFEAHGRSVLDIVADTSRPDGVAAAFDATIDGLGRVDVVVHLPGAAIRRPIAEIGDDDWRAAVATNLDSAFFMLRESARRVADDGRVILLSTSLTAVTVPGWAAYAPLKAAVESLVRTGAKELGGRGITVNAVAPGPLDSPFVRNVEGEERELARLAAFSPANRLGTWDDVAPAIAFLATPQAQWISAQTIPVNGAMVG